jgi:hypothetical protein
MCVEVMSLPRIMIMYLTILFLRVEHKGNAKTLYNVTLDDVHTYDFCLKSRTKKFSKPLYISFIHGTFQMENNHGRTKWDVENYEI